MTRTAPLTAGETPHVLIAANGRRLGYGLFREGEEIHYPGYVVRVGDVRRDGARLQCGGDRDGLEGGTGRVQTGECDRPLPVGGGVLDDGKHIAGGGLQRDDGGGLGDRGQCVLGGTLQVRSPAGNGTTLLIEIPVGGHRSPVSSEA